MQRFFITLFLLAAVCCAGCVKQQQQPQSVSIVDVVIHEFKSTPQDIVQILGQPHSYHQVAEEDSPYLRELMVYDIRALPFPIRIIFCNRNGVCGARMVDRGKPWWMREFEFYDGVYASSWRALQNLRNGQ